MAYTSLKIKERDQPLITHITTPFHMFAAEFLPRDLFKQALSVIWKPVFQSLDKNAAIVGRDVSSINRS